MESLVNGFTVTRNLWKDLRITYVHTIKPYFKKNWLPLRRIWRNNWISLQEGDLDSYPEFVCNIFLFMYVGTYYLYQFSQKKSISLAVIKTQVVQKKHLFYKYQLFSLVIVMLMRVCLRYVLTRARSPFSSHKWPRVCM